MGKVVQIMDSDQSMPASDPNVPWVVWADVTGNTDVQVGWKAEQINGVWTFTEPTYEELLNQALGRTQQLLEEAGRWLMFNPLPYKIDLGIATPSDEALLLAYKQYFVAVSEVKNQPSYPRNINWPVVPW
jgi:hypothetical protein